MDFSLFTEALLPEATALYNHYVLTTPYTHRLTPVAPEEMRDILHISHPVYRSFALTEQGEFIGYAGFSQFRQQEGAARTAELSLYLKPAFARRGFGAQALLKLEQEAAKAGMHVLLAVLDECNFSSRRLFEKAGYQVCGQLRHTGFKFGRYRNTIYLQKVISQA